MRVSKNWENFGFCLFVFYMFWEGGSLLVIHFLIASLVLLTEGEALERPLSDFICISIGIQLENYMKIR